MRQLCLCSADVVALEPEQVISIDANGVESALTEADDAAVRGQSDAVNALAIRIEDIEKLSLFRVRGCCRSTNARPSCAIQRPRCLTAGN